MPRRSGGVEYDDRATPVARTAATEPRGRVTVHDLEYEDVDGSPVRAFRVLPAAGGRVPAVVYAHPAPGNRTTYLDEAVALG